MQPFETDLVSSFKIVLFTESVYDKKNIKSSQIHLNFIFFGIVIKLWKKMGNMTKRKQFDQTADNSTRPPKVLRRGEKNPHPEACFSLSLVECFFWKIKNWSRPDILHIFQIKSTCYYISRLPAISSLIRMSIFFITNQANECIMFWTIITDT